MGVLNREDYKDEEILQTLYDYYKGYYEEHAIKNYPNNFERDYIIFKKWIAGSTFRAIGGEHGIGVQRVSTICQLYSRRYQRAKNILQEIKDGKIDPESLKRYDRADDRSPTHISVLGMTVRSVNGLARAGYTDLKDLSNISEEKFREIRNLGDKSCEEIIGRMKEFGIEFKPKEEYNEKVKKGTNECLKAYGIKPEDDDDAEEEEAEKDPVDDKVDEVNKTFLEKCLDKMKSQDTIDKIMDEYASDVRKAMAGRRFNSYPWATNNTDNPYVYDCAKAKILRSIINYNDDALKHINHIQLNECSAAAMLNHVEDIHNIITEENIYIIKLREILQKIPTIVIDMPTSVYNMTPLIMGFRMFADIHSFNIRYVVKDIITPRNSPIIIAIPKEMSIQIMNEINYNFSFLCKKYNVGHPVPIEINVAR